MLACVFLHASAMHAHPFIHSMPVETSRTPSDDSLSFSSTLPPNSSSPHHHQRLEKEKLKAEEEQQKLNKEMEGYRLMIASDEKQFSVIYICEVNAELVSIRASFLFSVCVVYLYLEH